MAETASHLPYRIEAEGELLPFLARDRNAAEVSARLVACTIGLPA